MNNMWRWIIGSLVVLGLLGMLVAVRSNRAAYYEARHTYTHRALVVPSDATRIRFSCTEREGSIATSNTCAFYVWKR